MEKKYIYHYTKKPGRHTKFDSRSFLKKVEKYIASQKDEEVVVNNGRGTSVIRLKVKLPTIEGHSATAFGLATSLFLVDHNLGIFYLILAGFVSLGRVLSRVHFLVDVLGGAVLGIFVSLLLENLFFVQRRSSSKNNTP